MFTDGFSLLCVWLDNKGWSVDEDYCVRDEIFFHGKLFLLEKIFQKHDFFFLRNEHISFLTDCFFLKDENLMCKYI